MFQIINNTDNHKRNIKSGKINVITGWLWSLVITIPHTKKWHVIWVVAFIAVRVFLYGVLLFQQQLWLRLHVWMPRRIVFILIVVNADDRQPQLVTLCYTCTEFTEIITHKISWKVSSYVLENTYIEFFISLNASSCVTQSFICWWNTAFRKSERKSVLHNYTFGWLNKRPLHFKNVIFKHLTSKT